MAMHDLGYRHWDEDAPYQKFSWLSISRYGVRLAWKSQWLKRIVIFAFMPFFGLLVAVFFYEQASNWPGLEDQLRNGVEWLESNQDVTEAPTGRVIYTPPGETPPEYLPGRLPRLEDPT